MKVYNTAQEFLEKDYGKPITDIKVMHPLECVRIAEEYAKQKVASAIQQMKEENMQTLGRAYNHL